MPFRQKSISVFATLVLALTQGLDVKETDDKVDLDLNEEEDMAELDDEGDSTDEVLTSEQALTQGLDVKETDDNVDSDLNEEEDMAELDDEGDSTDKVLTLEQATKIHGGIDTDKDGLLSMEEILRFSERSQRLVAEHTMKAVFPEMDVDKDGKLSLQEIRGDSDNSVAETTDQDKSFEEKKFKAADTNGNGFLEIDEAPAMLYPEMYESTSEIANLQELKRKDKDGDGELTIKEVWDWIDDSENKDEETTDFNALDKDEETTDFNALDKDGSGKLSLDEIRVFNSGRYKLQKEMKMLFELGDKDGDMHIGLDELHQAREKIFGEDAHYNLMHWAENGDL